MPQIDDDFEDAKGMTEVELNAAANQRDLDEKRRLAAASAALDPQTYTPSKEANVAGILARFDQLRKELLETRESLRKELIRSHGLDLEILRLNEKSKDLADRGESLSKELTGVRGEIRALDLKLHVEGQKRGAAETARDGWKQKAEDLQKVLDANEARERLRNPGIQVYEVGQKVLIDELPGIKVTVDGILIQEGSVSYLVSWFHEKAHHTAEILARYVRADDDHLPIPGTEDDRGYEAPELPPSLREGPSRSVGREPS